MRAGFFMLIIPIFFILIASLLTQKPYASVQNHNFMKIASIPVMGVDLSRSLSQRRLLKQFKLDLFSV